MSGGRGGHSTNFSIGVKKSSYRKLYGNTLHDLHLGPKSLMEPAIPSGGGETIGLHSTKAYTEKVQVVKVSPKTIL